MKAKCNTDAEATAGTTNINPSRIKERASLFREKIERFLDLQFATPVPKIPTLLRSLFITQTRPPIGLHRDGTKVPLAVSWTQETIYIL